MEVESVKCECCGLREDCTQEYIREVKSNFEGKWLCGLCSEAVRDEATKSASITKDQLHHAMDEALQEHITFCTKFRANPAVLVADGMRQMLRRRSGDHFSTPSKNFRRSSSTL